MMNVDLKDLFHIMSMKLTDVQNRWSAIELEAFTVISALQYFDVIIYGHHVDI